MCVHDPSFEAAQALIMSGSSTNEARALGAFIGMAVSDAIGAPVEFQVSVSRWTAFWDNARLPPC